MINAVRIWNFQCHEDLKVQFDDHVTTIVGPSDSGKSAIISAINWCLTNDLRGKSFVRHGADVVLVAVDLDGHKVSRRKGSKVNCYDWETDENEQYTFNAVANKVPEEVETLFNVCELNYQRQIEAPFWVFETGGSLAKELNRLVDLTLIDETQKRVNAKVRQIQTEHDFIEGRVEELEKALDDVFNVELCESELEQLEALEANINALQEDCEFLEDLIERIKTLQSEQVPEELFETFADLERDHQKLCQLKKTKKV